MNRREVTLNGNTYPLNGTNTVPITTATYALSDIEDLVFVNTGSNLVALTLPNPASVAGRSVTVKKTNTGANGITAAAYASENIEGAAGPYTLPNSATAARGTWTLASDGTNWWLASTASTATGGGNVSGTPVAGGLVSGAGVVSNSWGGLALRSAYTPGDGLYLFSITALPASTKMIIQVTQTDTAGGPFQAVFGASQNAAPHDIDWFQVYQDTIPSGSGPDATFFVTVFAVYA